MSIFNEIGEFPYKFIPKSFMPHGDYLFSSQKQNEIKCRILLFSELI